MPDRLLFLGRAVVAMVALVVALPVRAQVITKTFTRTFDGQLYRTARIFFTATGSEAVLTVGHAVGDCSTNQLCTVPADCGSTGWNCLAGRCNHPVELQVGYVAVIRKDYWCTISACSFALDPTCPPSTVCDGGGSCDPNSGNVRGLCLCGEGATGCGETDPVIPAGSLALEETFDAASGIPWTLGQAQIVTDPSRSYLLLQGGTSPNDPPTSFGQVRFHTHPGQDYVLTMKWTFAPQNSSLENCAAFTSATLTIETRETTCGP